MTRGEIEPHIVNDTTYHQGYVANLVWGIPVESPTTGLSLLLRDVPQYMDTRFYFHRSTRIGFSTWSREDLPLARGLWGDAAVTRYHGGSWSEQQIEDRLMLEIAAMEHERAQYWPMFLLETDEHIGCCGIHPRDKSKGIWELGCHLRRSFWSHHLGREAAQAVIAYAFGTLGVSAIFAGHHPENNASREFLRYLGFHYTHDEYYPPTQVTEPCYLLLATAKLP